jgi:hypothetical protein
MSDNNTNTSGSSERKIYTSFKQCATATGNDIKIIKQAKKVGAPGFLVSNRIEWNILKPWLDANRNTISQAAGESLEYYKTEIAKRDVTLRDLQIQKARREALDPIEVKKFLSQLAILLSSTLKKKKDDLMSKCTGYEDMIDKEFTEIFIMIQKEISVWK